jgi:hypothetical protein
VLLAHKVLLAQLDLLEQQAHKVQQDLLVHKVPMVQKVTLAILAHRAFQ